MISPIIRLAIIDRDRMLLDSFTYTVRAHSSMNLVHASTSEVNTADSLLHAQPDVILIDGQRSDCDPFEQAFQWSSQGLGCKIIFGVDNATSAVAQQVITSKAAGCLLKTEPMNVVLNSVQRAMGGEFVYSQAFIGLIQWDPNLRRRSAKPDSGIGALTPQQFRVLRHLALGLSVKETARAMSLSHKAVDNHKYRLMHKLDIHDRVELARFAIREGLVSA